MMDNLVERSREGGQTAFEALVRRHDRRVLSLASRLTGRLEDRAGSCAGIFFEAVQEFESVPE